MLSTTCWTRNSGFIWLGAALALWPGLWAVLAHTVIRPSLDQLAGGGQARMFSFTLVQQGRITAGWLVMCLSYIQSIGEYVLLLIAVVKLAAQRRAAHTARRRVG